MNDLPSNASVLIEGQLPAFINAQDGMFRIFLEAYYEYLELQRDSESTNVKALFNSVSGPSTIISGAQANRDIDTTLDAFVQFFYKQVIPVALDASQVDYRFGVKKVRDLYLAKGTPNSFRLFFRMLYSEEIDVIFPKDSILNASAGKYLSFPQVRAVVIEGQNVLSLFNYQLATLYNDSDGIDRGILVVDGFALSSIGNSTVINLTLNSGDVDLDFDRVFILQDATNPANFVKLRILVQLESAEIISSAPGYQISDVVRVYDPSLNVGQDQPTVGVASLRVDNVTAGSVEYVQFRDRGESYIEGDSISFGAPTVQDGSGGTATITGIDINGRIDQLNGINVRTGPFHNGYPTDDFVNTNIPITDGGNYKVFPTLTIHRQETNPTSNPVSAARYAPLGGLNLQDAQIYPISDTIARISKVVSAEPGFFSPTNVANIKVLPPFNLITSGTTKYPLGGILEFQYFLADSEGFRPDSEVLDILYTRKSARQWTTKTFTVPTAFLNDSENDSFQWVPARFTLTNTGDDADIYRQIAQAVLPGYAHIAPNPTGLWKINDQRLYPLDAFHFDQLNTIYNRATGIGFTYEDSDISVKYMREFQNPRTRTNTGSTPIMPKTGQFIGTGFGGRIERANDNGNQYSLTPYPQLLRFPTEADIDAFDEIPNSIIRAVQVNPITGDQITANDYPISSYVTQWNGDVQLKLKLSGPIYTAKRFVNEDGFLDSPSGAVLRDNYFFSESTYVIQSTHSIYDWGDKVRSLLHPAGTILVADLSVVALTDAPVIQDVQVRINVDNGLLQMDNTLDAFIQDQANFGNVTADSTVQATDPFLIFNRFSVNGLYLFADNFDNIKQASITSQYGNALWDYEPIGLVDNTTTQTYDPNDSDGQGNFFVERRNVFYNPWQASAADRYKGLTYNTNRYPQLEPVLLYRTFFADEVNEKYSVYNINDPMRRRRVYAQVFNDSDGTELSYLRSIDYALIRDSDYITNGNNRITSQYGSDRNSEIRLKQNIDLAAAMRLDKSLSFREGDKVYYDFEAYEVKWNTINTFRTINAQGWEIPGYESVLQNVFRRPDYQIRIKQLEATPRYATKKTPLTYVAFNYGDSEGNVIWRNHYIPQINRFAYDSDTLRPPYDSDTLHLPYGPYIFGSYRAATPDPKDLANRNKLIA